MSTTIPGVSGRRLREAVTARFITSAGAKKSPILIWFARCLVSWGARNPSFSLSPTDRHTINVTRSIAPRFSRNGDGLHGPISGLELLLRSIGINRIRTGFGRSRTSPISPTTTPTIRTAIKPLFPARGEYGPIEATSPSFP